MVRLVIVLVLVALVVLIVRGVLETRRRQALRATRASRGRQMPPPHQRVSDDELEARAAQLRRAVERGDITPDEAIDSLIRLGGSAVSPERARQMIVDR